MTTSARRRDDGLTDHGLTVRGLDPCLSLSLTLPLQLAWHNANGIGTTCKLTFV